MGASVWPQEFTKGFAPDLNKASPRLSLRLSRIPCSADWHCEAAHVHLNTTQGEAELDENLA
jgi:hypothetical protein